MDILQQLTSLLSTSGSFNQISRNANTSPEKAQQLATIAIPILLEALNRNTATLQGVRSLSYALDDHQHFDLNNLSEFFQNIDTKDGARILRHVFSDKNARVQENLAKQSGLNVGQVGVLLNQLAPMVLGLLGAQKKINISPPTKYRCSLHPSWALWGKPMKKDEISCWKLLLNFWTMTMTASP